MTGKEALTVYRTVENEGFHYAFHDYSHFDEVEDPEFHKLRVAYLEASKALADYVGCDL
jgi:hypothetical protein